MRATAPVLRLYPALGNNAFLLLWLGMMPATLAVMMNQVASPYAAFSLSGSAAVLGVVSLAQGVPMLLLSLVGGVVADRLQRKLVLAGSQTTLGLAAVLRHEVGREQVADFVGLAGVEVGHPLRERRADLGLRRGVALSRCGASDHERQPGRAQDRGHRHRCRTHQGALTSSSG